jgi:hypothetical protein
LNHIDKANVVNSQVLINSSTEPFHPQSLKKVGKTSLRLALPTRQSLNTPRKKLRVISGEIPCSLSKCLENCNCGLTTTPSASKQIALMVTIAYSFWIGLNAQWFALADNGFYRQQIKLK